MRRQLLSLFVLGICFAVVGAQEGKDGKTDKEPKKAASKKSGTEADVHFLNGSSVRLLLQSEKLEIETPYGKLAVPIKDVRAIEFGTHMPDGHAAKIEAALKKLGSGDFREREKAVAALVELGPYSYAAAVEATRGKEAEVAIRAKDVVTKLNAKFPKKDLKVNAEDRIVTPTFPIVGRILTPTIKAKADYFGEVELSMADMRTLRTIGGPILDVEVSIDAARHGTRDRTQWLATDFEVDGRSPIVITAKGQIDLQPEDPGFMLVGPNGVRMGAGGGFKGKGAASKAAGGLLLGKFGETGETFTVGDRFEGTPNHAGKLYLQINPSPYSNQSVGTYDVKASRKE